jgi:PAP2 superfamily protein
VSRPSGIRELAIGLGTYAAYLGVRRFVLAQDGRARGRVNAERVARLERRIGLDLGPVAQERALRVPHLVHALNAGYAGFNVMLTVGWMIRLWQRGDAGYPRERRAAVAAFAGGLPVFLLFPTAPPRTLDGYVDTIASSGVDIEHPFLLRFYNPVAAMPSEHVAFAVVTGAAVAVRSRGRFGRTAGRAYPLGVAAVVVVTGNHFVLDCLAGAALGAVARWLTR